MADAYLPASAFKTPPSLPIPRLGRSPHSKPCDTAAELVAALMWKAQTREELTEATGAHANTVDRWIAAFYRSGIVRVAGYAVNTAQGRRARIWALQSKPFATDDEPMPPRRDE